MIFGRVFSILILAGCIHSAQAQSEHGRTLVQQFCSPCHATAKTDISKHPAAIPLRRVGQSYELDKFAGLLQRGALRPTHPDMPWFKFDEDSATAVTNYLRSIQE
jgi:hypothetical protein